MAVDTTPGADAVRQASSAETCTTTSVDTIARLLGHSPASRTKDEHTSELTIGAASNGSDRKHQSTTVSGKSVSSSHAATSRRGHATQTLASQAIGQQNAGKGAVGSRAKKSAARVRNAGDVGLESQQKEEELTTAQRTRFATEIANVALKALTQAARAKSAAPKSSPRSKSSSRTSSCLSEAGTQGSEPKPLQSRSINRLSKTPSDKPRLPRRSSTLTSGSQFAGIVALAECARLAFAFLRKCDTESGQDKKVTGLQLEIGMSALIGKLIALGLDDLAVKELRILLRRVCPERSVHVKLPSKARTPAGGAALTTSRSLPDLLCIAEIPDNPQAISLVISAQMHILKVLSLRRRPSMMNAALAYLEISCASSPLNMIERITDALSADSCAKTVRLYEQLAQALNLLCPGTSLREDTEIAESRNDFSPQSSLRYQVLKLHACFKSWILTGKKANLRKDAFGPFMHHFRAFVRRSRLPPSEKYDFAKVAIEDSMQAITPRNVDSIQKLFTDQIPQEACILLADLARDCNDIQSAILWAERSAMKVDESDSSKSVLCTTLCQLGCLGVQLFLQGNCSESPRTKLQRVIHMLKGNLNGSSTEIDGLFVMLAKLRKLSLALLIERFKAVTPSPQTDDHFCEDECKEIILLSLNFLIRYAGRNDGLKTEAEANVRQEHRIEVVAKVINPTVEALTAIARAPIIKATDSWDRIDSSLQECARLLTNIHCIHGSTEHSSFPKHSRLPFVLLSNAYWCRFLEQKQRGCAASDLQGLIRQSIDLLDNRPVAELEAGLLHIKFERLGSFYEMQHNWAQALESYSKAIDTLLSIGSLDNTIRNIIQLPLAKNSGSYETLSSLDRLLSIYSRVDARRAESECRTFSPYDNLKLEPVVRGVLLESQLSAVTALLPGRSFDVGNTKFLEGIFATLLDIYSEEQYPLQRLRVSIQVLKGQFLCAAAYNTHEIASLCSQPPTCAATRDGPLEMFRNHMLARRDMYIAVLKPELGYSLLQRSLETWNDLVSSGCSWPDLLQRIDNFAEWIGELEVIRDYLHMQGEDRMHVLVLHLLGLVRASDPDFDSTTHVIHASALARQLVRLGYSGKAGGILQKAQIYVEEDRVTLQASVQWHLAYAEYALEIGDSKKGTKTTSVAHETYQRLCEQSDAKAGTQRTRTIICSRICLASELLHVESLCASHNGNAGKAVYFARKSSKLAYRAWAITERHQAIKNNRQNPARKDHESSPDFQPEISVSQSEGIPVMSTKHESLNSSPFWPLVPSLFHQLIRLANLLSEQGLLPETEYYLDQAAKIAQAVRSKPLQAMVRIMQASSEFHAGKVEESLSSFLLVSRNIEGVPLLTQVKLQLGLARVYAARSEFEEEAMSLSEVKNLLQQSFCAEFLVFGSEPSDAIEDIGSKLRNLDIAASSGKQTKPNRSKPPIGKSKRTAQAKSITEKPMVEKCYSAECLPLLRQQACHLRQEASLALRLTDLEHAASLLASTEGLTCFVRDSIPQALSQAQLLLHQGLEMLSVDPVLSLLQESAITCPSIALTGKRHSKDLSVPTNDLDLAKPKNAKSTVISKVPKAKQSSRAQEVGDILSTTVQVLTKVHAAAQGFASSAEIRKLADKLCKSLLLLSAACPSNTKLQINSCFVAYAMELGRSIPIIREKATIAAERLLDLDQESTMDGSLRHSVDLPHFQIDASSFQKDYIDIIPETWTVVSLSISENHDELRLSKIRAGQAPLILAIPLSRHNSRDCDEEIFGYEEGKAELREIIGLANYSTHDKRDMSQKGAKTEWWEVRAALDARLKDLLVNIENIWLGGFRGVLSSSKPEPQLLSRFQQSFYNILDKHLPSRRRKGKAAKQSKVTLDSHVLELFVSLGDPRDVGDLDEPLMDLLYYVVDILQFHGERNAYDEIDFDPLVIETLDALSHYHSSAKDGPVDAQKHTILIMDKCLHDFPWESLPCMKGQAISRLPSLTSLRDRILGNEKAIGASTKASSLMVDRGSGSYILNPGGDLVATQETFRKPLSALTSWSATINKTPTEKEIAEQLSSSSIYLYFGHGSGGQYIRSRTVKKLEHCAVALLMGCSSALLTEAGEFESYGTPINYLHAGAPAVVGTLWDVTDKDIDRFSMATLVKWGLLAEPSSEMTSGTATKKGKGRARAKEAEARSVEAGEMSLDRAVAEARESCIFRYLNGAAPVIYGVPISLA